MKKLKVTPGAKRLIESLRNMGYDTSAAIADLVDNSISAGASEVHIEIVPKSNAGPAFITVADNGDGMDRPRLEEAMRFGAFQEYSMDDLGKYGLGLKTASLSQCRALTVSSKFKAARDRRTRKIVMRWDLEHVYKADKWEVLLPTDEELEPWEIKALEDRAVAKKHGTVVLWSNLDALLSLLSSAEVNKREKELARLIEEVEGHLTMVFHRFMQGAVTGHRKLVIHINGVKLIPWDPFCRSEDTKELGILRAPVTYRGPDSTEHEIEVVFSPFILPREDEFSEDSARKAASGPRGWNQQQGFYFYRNNRLLQAGGWSHLRSVDEHLKLLRVAVDFSGDLDHQFSINITKARAKIPSEIRESVKSHVVVWAKEAQSRYRAKPEQRRSLPPLRMKKTSSASTAKKVADSVSAVSIGPITFLLHDAPGHNVSVEKARASGQTKVLIPRTHELADMFKTRSDGNNSVESFCLMLAGILEAVFVKKMSPKAIPLAAIKKKLAKII